VKGGEGREERGNGSMHPLGLSKVGAYALKPGFRSLATLKLVVNVVGEL